MVGDIDQMDDHALWPDAASANMSIGVNGSLADWPCRCDLFLML